MDYNNELKPIMTAKEVADFLGVGLNCVYEMVRAQKIKALPIGRRVKIPRHAVLEFIGAVDQAA